MNKNSDFVKIYAKNMVLNAKDFTLYGEARSNAVDASCNYNFVNRSTASGKTNYFFWTYSIGDDLTTDRGITIGDSIDKVFEKYGAVEKYFFNPTYDYLFSEIWRLHESDEFDENEDENNTLGDFKNFKEKETYVDYIYDSGMDNVVYIIRFYFDKYDRVLLIGYFNMPQNVYLDYLAIMIKDKKIIELCNKPDYKLIHRIQYVMLPNLVLNYPDNAVKYILGQNDENFNPIYNLFQVGYKDIKEECPYKPEDFIISNKILYSDEKIFYLIKIKFNIEYKVVLAKEAFIVYTDDFKTVRYFTAEYDEQSEKKSMIQFSEIFTDDRFNYGEKKYDDKILESFIMKILKEDKYIY